VGRCEKNVVAVSSLKCNTLPTGKV
jgi:hypothetical protein